MSKSKCCTWKCYIILAFSINILIAIITLHSFDNQCQCDCSSQETKHLSYVRIKDREHYYENLYRNFSSIDLSTTIAFVFREFEFFENDISSSVQSILEIFPNVNIYIISDDIPYPPLLKKEVLRENIKMISLKPALGTSPVSHQPLAMIKEDHIFIIPDSVRMTDNSQILSMLKLHFQEPAKIIAAPLQDMESVCLMLNVSLRYWTMKFKQHVGSRECNALEGVHILLVAKSLLMQFSNPFIRPLPLAMAIQATLLKKKILIAQDIFFTGGKQLYNDEHNQWKFKRNENERRANLFKELGIKKIIHPAAKVEWYGCHKNSNRCFGTVFNNMPEYLFHGRWTPPCCLENLRQTARYVFGILEKCKVRYWLEGGSLLGAVRTGDIIPWDYDVDIGIYQEDIEKCEWLKNSQQQSIVDTQGFVWEKATEGDFIRVQFSQSNHLHVDIFPFYSRNGTMTKNTWFVDHKQDTEFPEHFLEPLYKIKFVGISASAPNNYRTFLEMKFGKGAIENPEYPDPKVMKFLKRS